MTAIVARDARAFRLNTIVANNSDLLVEGAALASSLTSNRQITALHDRSLFDHVDDGRAASDYSRSSGAKRANLYRKALYLLVIFCL